MKYPRIVLKSFADFFRDGGIVLAGSLSYFSMMALVPLCLFLITIFGYILGHYQGFYEFFSSKLSSFFPDITTGNHQRTPEAHSVQGNRNIQPPAVRHPFHTGLCLNRKRAEHHLQGKKEENIPVVDHPVAGHHHLSDPYAVYLIYCNDAHPAC